MATRAFKPKKDDMLTGWQAAPERAPSELRDEGVTTPRLLAMAALLLVAVGGLAMLAPIWKVTYAFGPVFGVFLFAVGLAGLLYHAFVETDIQFRKLYTFLGFGLAVLGAAMRFWPGDAATSLFLAYGTPCLLLGLGFLLAVARQLSPEENVPILTFLALLGLVGAIAGFGVGVASRDFVQGEGLILILLGLLYLCSYAGMQETLSNKGYLMGLAIGAIGLAGVVMAGLRSWGSDFFIPSGLLLVLAGLVYLGVSLGICSDRLVIVLARRELAAFFYSPIAYLVIFAMIVVGAFNFAQFAGTLVDAIEQRGFQWEPILGNYIIGFIPVMCLLFVTSIITMRLLSEERRSGTLEVMLTAPINEGTLVVSKFIASLIFYIICLIPWAMFLVALRVGAGEPFDIRPGLSFFLALVCSGSVFLSIGLFYSSLTRNQIVAAVLSLMTILAMTAIFFLKGNTAGAWNEFLTYISYIDLWLNALSGNFSPRHLFVYLSIAAFFLYLTTKVLESRKWS